jgi:hypothetical protein
MERGGWSATGYAAGRERSWHLSVLLANEARAWSAHELVNGRCAALRWSVDGSALDDEALPVHPASVSFVTLPEWSSLVPDGALEPGSEDQHLAFVHGHLPTGALREQSVPQLGATCIYAHDDLMEREVLDRFPHARPIPMQSLMVRSALAQSNEGPVAVLHRSHDRLDAAVADRGRLLLSNTFPARASQDALYYALLIAEGCAIRPGDLRVVHGGTHLSAHERDLLDRYFMQAAPAWERWDGLPSDAPVEPSRWMAVLEQFACV